LFRRVYTPESGREVGEEMFKRRAENGLARDDHIVMTGPRGHGRDLSHRSAQAPAHPVALDGAAGFLGYGKADTRHVFGCAAAAQALKGQQAGRGAFALGSSEKIPAPGEAAKGRLLRRAGPGQ
jgi:hypothetical protein